MQGEKGKDQGREKKVGGEREGSEEGGGGREEIIDNSKGSSIKQ